MTYQMVCSIITLKEYLRGLFYAGIIYVYGIIIRMQSERGGKHNKPHIHAIYGEAEIVVALDGEVLE